MPKISEIMVTKFASTNENFVFLRSWRINQGRRRELIGLG